MKLMITCFLMLFIVQTVKANCQLESVRKGYINFTDSLAYEHEHQQLYREVETTSQVQVNSWQECFDAAVELASEQEYFRKTMSDKRFVEFSVQWEYRKWYSLGVSGTVNKFTREFQDEAQSGLQVYSADGERFLYSL